MFYQSTPLRIHQMFDAQFAPAPAVRARDLTAHIAIHTDHSCRLFLTI